MSAQGCTATSSRVAWPSLQSTRQPKPPHSAQVLEALNHSFSCRRQNRLREVEQACQAGSRRLHVTEAVVLWGLRILQAPAHQQAWALVKEAGYTDPGCGQTAAGKDSALGSLYRLCLRLWNKAW